MDFAEVYERHEGELSKVEQILHHCVQSNNRRLTESARQLIDAGGKRIRPLFAILCSRFGASRGVPVYEVAAALELIHMATLVHDDVIDGADLRRGQPTVRSRFGNRPAMYTGDFLFARAIELLTTVSSPMVHMEMSEAIVRMCEGEIEQIRDFYNWKQSLRNYLRRVERKTALLISISCSLGALSVDAPEPTVSALRRFGYYTGMAFQIIDDVLDYSGDEQTVGKPVAGDLRQGNITLPALFAAKSSAQTDELRSLIRLGMNQDDVSQAVTIIRSSQALPSARNLAVRYMQKAVRELELISEHPVKEELSIVAHYVNQRVS